MEFLPATALGFFFGFALGVGCALAVMYSIYAGGYRKAVADSLQEDQPERFRKVVSKTLMQAGRGNGHRRSQSRNSHEP